MVPEDVYELTGAGDPRLSQDAAAVAFVVWRIDREESEYRSAIWLVPVDGSAPPRQLTAGEKRDSSPRWSPDGKRLAFTSSRGDEKAAQVYVLPLEGGEPVRVTGYQANERIEPCLKLNAFSASDHACHINSRLNDRNEIHGMDVKAQLACHYPRNVEEVID